MPLCLSIVLYADCLGISTIYKAFKKTQRDSEKLNNKNFFCSSQYHAYFIQVPILYLLFTGSDNKFRIFFLYECIHLISLSSLKLNNWDLQFLSHYYILQTKCFLDCPFKVCFIGDFLDCNTIPYVANKMLFLMEPLNLFYGWFLKLQQS